MAQHEEPGEPASPQSNGIPTSGDEDTYHEVLEVRLEIERRLPDGFIRGEYTYKRSFLRSRRSRRAPFLKYNLRIIVALIIFFTLIVIGLIAVGPEGVWSDIRGFLPDLLK